jgi:DNA-binding NarL/FixJ family response regulator
MTPRKLEKSRLLLVDDHPLVRRGLAEIISDQPDLEFCGEAEDLVAAFRQYQALRPDLVILDISLKDGHGLDLIKQIKHEDPAARILVFSMHDDSLFAERAIAAGALGYVNKQEDARILVQAIRRVLEGRIYLNSALSEHILERALNPASTSPLQAVQSLTDRELEVFELVGQGLSTQQIAERLFLSHKTIETYREHIKRKLNLANAAGLTRAAVLWLLENRPQ